MNPLVKLVLVLILLCHQAGAQTAPRGCNATAVATGGTAVQAVQGAVNGGYIRNPLSAADEGLGATEPLYVNDTGTATLTGNGTTTALAPGQSYVFFPTAPGQQGVTYTISVNAPSNGHTFECKRD